MTESKKKLILDLFLAYLKTEQPEEFVYRLEDGLVDDFLHNFKYSDQKMQTIEKGWEVYRKKNEPRVLKSIADIWNGSRKD